MKTRLALLASVDQDVTESEVFRLALQHAMGQLGGLGAAVHLRGPTRALGLVSAAGLPPRLAREWETVDQEGDLAPASAVRRGHQVWVPMDATVTHGASGTGTEWPGSGWASVPVSRGGRTVGALTVLAGEAGEPTPEQWGFLRDVAAWAEERSAQAPPPRPVQEGPDAGRIRDALKEIRVGSWDWNIRTGELALDEGAMALYGTDPADFVPVVASWMKVVHPADLAWTLAAVEKAIHDRTPFEAEYRVRRPDGTYGWTQSRGTCVLDDDGEPVRMIGMGWDSDESRTARDSLSRALRHMTDGFLGVDDDWRITFANLEAERLLGSFEEELSGRVLWELPSARDALAGLEARCREAAARDTPVSFDVENVLRGHCHHLRLVPVPDGLTLYFTDVTERRRHQAERAAAERAAAERSARIAELTEALAAATTSRDVVEAVAQRVLPPFGAAGLVVQAIEGDRVYNVGSVGYAADFLETINGRPRVADDPVWDALLTGAPLFISSMEEYAARYPELAHRPVKAGKQAWAFLPLTTSGHTFGVCAVAFDRPRRLTDEERTLLNAISALVAHALDRARLYDAEYSRSRELQRGLLPRELPDLAACTAAARYLPAGQGMDVGGDWYDIIPLSAGRVALVIGDVMGHGLPQAVTMGRLRTAVHTLAHLELAPDEILGHLNEIVVGLGEDSYATCLYALYDSTTGTCVISRAGHPPPAVLHPDGSVTFPELVPDPPLGAAEPPFDTVELTIPPESLLVMYTDGLVESARREIDEGMADLARLLAAPQNAGKELEALCDTITAGLLPADQPTADDAALLVVRLHALTPDRMASWPLPEAPQAAGEARKHVREQLSTWGLDDLSVTTELLASELVGNVVRHAKGPVRLRLLHGADLVCEVSDGSLTTPRIRRALETDEGGRGLRLVTALSQRWGTRYTATGKCIWTEQALPGADPPGDGTGEALGEVLDEALDGVLEEVLGGFMDEDGDDRPQ
ncbi:MULTISPECIES: SpoIIE family protein phosphatase [unclassified Streptomyces]|uniref:SpoIIE family protein phosphatase n=1 Tax=unclassified Streptomyces TaxID=2593676 RepID=UPI00382AD552